MKITELSELKSTNELWLWKKKEGISSAIRAQSGAFSMLLLKNRIDITVTKPIDKREIKNVKSLTFRGIS